MKKIAISLGIIGVVAAIVIGATTAYFSDTETSTGNTFTAGSIDLKVDNTSYYDIDGDGDLDLNSGTSWQETDLDGELFFDFADLKPGDLGEDTVSLHVYNNDAWACVTMKLTMNDDMTENQNDIDCTEPELEDGDNCGDEPDPDPFDGDLAQELNFIFWVDDGDNVLEIGEEPLMGGPAIDVRGGVTYTLADAYENNVGGEVGDPLTGSHTYYIGKAWCFGKLIPAPLPQDGINTQGPDVRGPGVSCDGKNVDNKPQSDQVKGDIIFYAEQARNNDDFQCGR